MQQTLSMGVMDVSAFLFAMSSAPWMTCTSSGDSSDTDPSSPGSP